MRPLFALLIFLFTINTEAAGWEDSPHIGDLFRSAGVNGTFVFYDVSADTFIGHNKARAETRFLPASTFKIPNTLIGLSLGAAGSVDEVLPYKGPEQPFIKAWKKDMSLREAIKLSNVPIYQELARRIGLERMRDSIVRLDYGNQEIGNAVDRFWLDGPLKISAIEQVRFLTGLAQGSLPFPQDSQAGVRDIILLEQESNWKLFGKTGWQGAPGQGVGWWVGWMEKTGQIYVFALNIDIQDESDANKRTELGKACLVTLGMLQRQ